MPLPWRIWLGRWGLTPHGLLVSAQLLLLMLGWKASQREVWLPVLAVVAALALLAWVMAWWRRHAIEGTPTSRIATAAQGLVELRGVGRPLDINPLHSPVSGMLCLWYQYQVERRTSDNKWETVEQDRSHTSFVLDDGSGTCLVDPEGAEVVTRHCKRWSQGDYRYVEWTLRPDDRLYVLGQFLTRHPAQGLDARAEVGALLAEWKRDAAGLLRRFDLNRDGQLDDREWELARRLAQGQVEQRHRELRQQPELHLVQGSADSLYLISNHEPQRLAARYLWIGLAQLLVFFLAVGWAAWWWRQPTAMAF
ncbi:MAG: GIDE domain-containing protein [Hylemonella sp.]